MNHLSPEMARFQLELGELPHQKKRSFEAFRLGLKTHEKVYEELADHKQADICSINIPVRNLVIANVEYANQLNSYYDENYLYETLLQALVEEAILNKCSL
ncbi:hypothetical protein [Acinetobacter shaoyimingii]|uniref:Uncharacterized protein n=1 Tax=Acinetobacter shaoyimingii TaxID=2715164 RepID=A0A6G8RYI1_9GAMM|nr:hypothetical protein [Acinetobacter shaoyimingii]QIO06957.1 hypothetical protein G8E00_13930 [Acinetobacter shaoyimingii]